MIAIFSAIRKPWRLFLLPLFALMLAACEPIAMGSGAGSGGPKIDPKAPVQVALLVPRGGTAADNLLAQNLENAAKLAIAEVPGVKINLRVYGTAGNASQAASAANQAVAEGAKIILGPVYGEAANAAGVAVASKGINVLSFSNNPTIAGGNVFILGPTFGNTADRLVGFAKRQGKREILILHGQDIGGQLGRDAITRAAASNGVKIAGAVDYALSQQGVTAAVPRVKAAMESSGADALFLTSNSASALPLFAQMLPQAGVTPTATQYIGLTRWDKPAETLGLPGVQGGWFALPDTNAQAAFRQRYKAAYGSQPLDIAGLSFDGIAAIGSLVKAGKSNALTGAALTQGAGFRGANGIFRFRKDGTNERGLAIATAKGGKLTILEPAPRAFGGAGF